MLMASLSESVLLWHQQFVKLGSGWVDGADEGLDPDPYVEMITLLDAACAEREIVEVIVSRRGSRKALPTNKFHAVADTWQAQAQEGILAEFNRTAAKEMRRSADEVAIEKLRKKGIDPDARRIAVLTDRTWVVATLSDTSAHASVWPRKSLARVDLDARGSDSIGFRAIFRGSTSPEYFHSAETESGDVSRLLAEALRDLSER